jgi:glycerol-3-phosphate dehydrogenase
MKSRCESDTMIRDLDALQDREFDLLIVGGGITGAGVALDAALRGIRVALIDRNDFAAGTSSVSSKLIHGGLRYLEHAEFRLVHEALNERGRLLRNAPHLVRPLRFVMPFLTGAHIGPWRWRAGLFLYDLLAGRDNIRRARAISLSSVRREFPGLRQAGLTGAAEFYDAQMDDARLCLAVVRSAWDHGARVANHFEVTAFERSGSRIVGVRALDHLSGKELPIRARVVLNAAGPWADAVRSLAGEKRPPLLSPTKGVHLLAPGRGHSAGFLLLHPDDDRVFFVLPWLGKMLIGTTDTDWSDGPDSIGVTEADISYLLRGFNHYFRTPLTPTDLLGSFAGLRPLLRADADPSSRSREYRIVEDDSGLLTVVGGKYTTYRAMAETITDVVAARLRNRRRCRTRSFRLDGAPDGDWSTFAESTMIELQSQYGLAAPSARHLVDRYGRRTTKVAAYLERDPSLAKPIVEGEPDLFAEFAYQRDHEMAVTPDDFLLRRTRLGLFYPKLLANSRCAATAE